MAGNSKSRLPRKGSIVLLCLLGLVFSCVALYQHVIYSHGLASEPSFCNISRHINCEAVNASPWSIFFGIPVAAYGLFFYVALLGLVLCSDCCVSGRKAHEVILFLSLVASLLSLALFCISEFVIGALCIMCIGIYLTNFALLGVTWWSGVGGSFVSRVFGGVQNLCEFLIEACTGQWRALLGVVALVGWATASASSSDLLLKSVTKKKIAREEASIADVVQAWRVAELVVPNVNAGAGAFGDYVKGGDESAPIQIVEFADMECPACRKMHVALGEILGGFSGYYRLVFKNYPLDQECNTALHREFHRSACFAAYAARCAGEQGKFWEALDAVVSDPALEDHEGDIASVHETLLTNLGSQLALDREALKECVSSGRYKSRMEQDVAEGTRIGVTSTPSFWVNGKKVVAPSPKVLTAILETVLAERGIVRTPSVTNATR